MQEDCSMLWLNLPKFQNYFSDPYWPLSLQAALFSCGFVPFVLTNHYLFGCSACLYVVISSLKAHKGLVLVLASTYQGDMPSSCPRVIRSPWTGLFLVVLIYNCSRLVPRG